MLLPHKLRTAGVGLAKKRLGDDNVPQVGVVLHLTLHRGVVLPEDGHNVVFLPLLENLQRKEDHPVVGFILAKVKKFFRLNLETLTKMIFSYLSHGKAVCLRIVGKGVPHRQDIKEKGLKNDNLVRQWQAGELGNAFAELADVFYVVARQVEAVVHLRHRAYHLQLAVVGKFPAHGVANLPQTAKFVGGQLHRAQVDCRGGKGNNGRGRRG